ncbi:hypothetical protein AB205_0009690 [Aquarana catesbeiana]|uniref:Uncharacterized protein n=1 Tax=Aquarana catesbeiana TaxID=8400 RepID=A0A2G9RTC6_AQUCT|nr:hypothetical protein AB205_0009690 [Aquarana catesbeiana]
MNPATNINNGSQFCAVMYLETLLLLLKSLPLGCYFNIYGFGHHFKSFFPKLDLPLFQLG